MKKLQSLTMAFAGFAAAFALTGCDWSSGGDGGFNTSRGAGININWSGVYNGINGREAVQGRGIRSITINQAGNSVQVIDSSGARYSGTIGAPGAVSEPNATTGTYPAGAELVQAQISFAGNGVEFAGIFHAVAVNEINGDASSDSDASIDANQSGSSDATAANQTTTVNNGDTTTIRTISTSGGTTVEIITVRDNQTQQIISQERREYQSSGSASADSDGRTVSRTYVLAEQNTQHRLEGTWVVEGGGAFRVDAISRGNSGSITTVAPDASAPSISSGSDGVSIGDSTGSTGGSGSGSGDEGSEE